MNLAYVFWINGPVIKARSDGEFAMKESVSVGECGLAGEVIRLYRDTVTIQVFEDTTGLKPGDVVKGEGAPLSVRLGPGMPGRMYDGIQRPLDRLARLQGDFIERGKIDADDDRRWHFVPGIEPGDRIGGGSSVGSIDTGASMPHRVMVRPGLEGKLNWVAAAGEYNGDQVVARFLTQAGDEIDVKIFERWPIRTPRPVASRVEVSRPLLTGQRILDTFFPVGKGGTGALPGGFGTGKTVLEQTVAKWCDADIIVYIGCGERGNEMAGVLSEFPELEDPRTGRRLMERTVMIANTSNMPVAAREASIYTGITIAEYFRDQGLNVALFADSISRWAEALREISGRLEELPAEEGYPSYLPTRLAEFFERAGQVKTLAGDNCSLTVVGTVSPPGGDFSEPVTSHARRFVKSFWALDRERAQARFYPAVDPLTSYSEYLTATSKWWGKHGGLRWSERRERMLTLLQEQQRLQKMVKIVGRDALPDQQRLILVCAEVFIEGFLRQSAFSMVDRFCGPEKQTVMLELMDRFLELANLALGKGVPPEDIHSLPVVRSLQRMGEEIPNGDDKSMRRLSGNLEQVFQELMDSCSGESA